MTDVELTARLRRNLLAFKSLQARNGLLRSISPLPGVRAFALPSRPQNLFQQQVMYDNVEALAEALAPLEVWYRAQGVRAWRVPVLPGDTAAQATLARFGHRAEDGTPAMGLPLHEEVSAPAPSGCELIRPDGMDEVVEINRHAYGPEDVGFITPWRIPPGPDVQLHPLVACEGGRPLACGVSLEEGDTVGIYLVATHPEARRRGLAAAVMRGLHADARSRGCTAAVLQATAMGYSVYRRLGYREVGVWTSWVYRCG